MSKSIICFNRSDVQDMYGVFQDTKVDDKYVGGQLSQEQFAVFEEFCSGSKISGSMEETIAWVHTHADELHTEAAENKESCGYYDLPMGYCKFFGVIETTTVALEDVIKIVSAGTFAYETTSGTILFRDPNIGFFVMIPKHREEGFHAEVLKMVRSGMSSHEIDRELNPHRYVERDRSGPKDRRTKFSQV